MTSPQPWTKYVIGALAIGTLSAGFGSAQIEQSSSGTSCGAFSYVLVAGGNRNKTPLQVDLNGKQVSLTREYGNEKTTVSSLVKAKNKIKMTWQVKATLPGGKAYGSSADLKLMNGSRATSVFFLDTGNYPNRRELTYTFAAPPRDNIACASEHYTLTLNGGGRQVVEWTVSVNGQFYVYHLSARRFNNSIDLRPFLKKGSNKVTLDWRVIVADGKGTLRDAAFISSNASGSTKRLLTVEPKAALGSQGSQSVTINVK